MFKKSLKIRVYLRLFCIHRNIIVILIATVLAMIICHSKWYFANGGITPYIATLIYTPLYILCQTRLTIPVVPYFIMRTKPVDRLKTRLFDMIISALMWGGALIGNHMILLKYHSIMTLFLKLLLVILYFIAVASFIHISYILMKKAVISFAITLNLLMVDYYLSFLGGFMGIRGILLYTIFAEKSFLKSFIVIFLLNIILGIIQIYLYCYNMDSVEWEIA